MLKEIAADDILKKLLADSRSDNEDNRKTVTDRLVLLGGAAGELLLTAMKESENKTEQRRPMKMISRIGSPAFPALKEHIQAGEPPIFSEGRQGINTNKKSGIHVERKGPPTS